MRDPLPAALSCGLFAFETHRPVLDARRYLPGIQRSCRVPSEPVRELNDAPVCPAREDAVIVRGSLVEVVRGPFVLPGVRHDGVAVCEREHTDAVARRAAPPTLTGTEELPGTAGGVLAARQHADAPRPSGISFLRLQGRLAGEGTRADEDTTKRTPHTRLACRSSTSSSATLPPPAALSSTVGALNPVIVVGAAAAPWPPPTASSAEGRGGSASAPARAAAASRTRPTRAPRGRPRSSRRRRRRRGRRGRARSARSAPKTAPSCAATTTWCVVAAARPPAGPRRPPGAGRSTR